VFEEFTSNKLVVHNPAERSYLFDLVESRSLRYLTFLKSEFLTGNELFDWTVLMRFENIEVVHVESSPLTVLDIFFGSLTLSRLHTLVIKSSNLSFINREALEGKENLRKLILAKNELKNFIWLTGLKKPLTSLWHLDLSGNKLTYIPPDLKVHIPSVRVLLLSDNQLNYYSLDTLEPWFNIDEFHVGVQEDFIGKRFISLEARNAVLHFTLLIR